MDICYATDDNFCMQTVVSMLSVIANAQGKPLRFHLLDAGVSVENYSRLAAVAQNAEADLVRYDVQSLLEKIQKTGQKSWGDFPTHATWARLFLPELLPKETDRVLYLDGDVIAAGDFTPLFEMNMGDSLVAAVEDCVGRVHKEKIGLTASARYINAGVLLFDLASWRNQYEPDWIENYLTTPMRYPMADQDVINLMFVGRCKYLPLRYNYSTWFRALELPALKRLMQDEMLCTHTQQEQDACKKKAVFIHYNTCSLLVRPWYKDATDPATECWLKYHQLSEWKDLPLLGEPPVLSAGERKDRNLYQTLGKNLFVPVHDLKMKLHRLWHT